MTEEEFASAFEEGWSAALGWVLVDGDAPCPGSELYQLSLKTLWQHYQEVMGQ